MSVQEFHDVFYQEIDRYLARLAKKTAGTHAGAAGSPCSPMQSRRSSNTGGTTGCVAELTQLGELRRLAVSMVDNVLQRLTDNAAYWGLDDVANVRMGAVDSGPGTGIGVSGQPDGGVPAAPAAPAALAGHWRSAACASLTARCGALEEELREKQQEETRRKAELLTRFKSDNDSVLQSHLRELKEVQQMAMLSPSASNSFDFRTANPAPCQSSTAGTAELHGGCAEHVGRVRGQLRMTKDVVSRVEHLMEGLEKLEGIQRRPISSLEVPVARASSNDIALEDHTLTEAIQRGEQVCKRLRRHRVGT